MPFVPRTQPGDGAVGSTPAMCPECVPPSSAARPLARTPSFLPETPVLTVLSTAPACLRCLTCSQVTLPDFRPALPAPSVHLLLLKLLNVSPLGGLGAGLPLPGVFFPESPCGSFSVGTLHTGTLRGRPAPHEVGAFTAPSHIPRTLCLPAQGHQKRGRSYR